MALAVSCMPAADETCDALPSIEPDYVGVTVPKNIAPLDFCVPGADAVRAEITGFEGKRIKVSSRSRDVIIPVRKWHELLRDSDSLSVEVTASTGGKTVRYAPFGIRIAEEADRYLTYRLIEPGYEVWDEMGLYQRDITSFKETPIVLNTQLENGCVNCHNTCNGDPSRFVFHSRVECAGTYVFLPDGAFRLGGKLPETISAPVYPQWHPSGEYIAFTNNITKQSFHTKELDRIEMFDEKSDVIIYDLKRNAIVTRPELRTEDHYENYPTFSPDGRKLYFCSAPMFEMPREYSKVHYSLCSVDFDPGTATIGSVVDTLWNASERGGSVTVPRVSPDGRFLLFTRSESGQIFISHRDADLYLIDLQDGRIFPAEGANSTEAESYHSWSRNSRWIVFSSKRLDKVYTRLFVAHVDENGKTDKAFLLPQKRYSDNLSRLWAYNVPEFVTARTRAGVFRLFRLSRRGESIIPSYELQE